MATGANIQPGRGREVTNLPPQVDLRTGEAEVWDSARRVFDQFTAAARPDLIRRAQARGAEEGLAVAEGAAMPQRGLLFGGDVAAARTAALETAYTAKTRTDIDAREAELRREHRYDVEGYRAAAAEMVSGFIQGAPVGFGADVELYAKQRVAGGVDAVATARSARDEQETVQALGVRAGVLDERGIAMAARPDFNPDSPDYAANLAERDALQTQRENNPAILYSHEQRIADDEKFFDGVTTAITTREAIGEYQANGRGLAGYAAATRHLNEEVLQGEAYKDMSPERRQRVYRDSLSQVRDFSAVDREDQRVKDEQERQANAERREKVGDYRLQILLGGTDRATIMADTSLNDGDKAGLVASIEAQSRRAASDARRDAALEASNARGAYAEVRDQARAGTLSDGEIADHLNAGTITAGQAVTLRTMTNRALKPIIDDVLAPVRDAARGPGMSLRGTAVPMAQAESHAATWARGHPDATLEERITFGRFVATTVFNRSAGQPQANATADGGRAARIAAVTARINAARTAGRPMSQAEQNRLRNEAIHGN